MATDPKTAEKLVQDYGVRLYGFCRKLAFLQADADDIYQQTFLRILVMPGEVDVENNPAGFLMSIAARIWHDEVKKYARRNRIFPVHSGQGEIHSVSDEALTETLVLKKEAKDEVLNAVQSLSDTLRIPVLLFYMGDLSTSEIANTLRVPQGTIKSRLHQARKILKTELELLGYGK